MTVHTRDWGTIAETAETYGVHPRTVRRWIADGLVDAVRVGPRLVRIDMDSAARMGQKIGGRA